MSFDRKELESEQAPPASEQVHLPGPSYLPVLVALGITIVLLGVVLTWPVIVIGVVIFLIAAVRWVRQVRDEMSRLPVER